MVCFIENLTLPGWILGVLPSWARTGGLRKSRPLRCCYIDGSRLGIRVARSCARLLGFELEQLRFRLIDIRDDNGALVELRIRYFDLFDVRNEILKDGAFEPTTAAAPVGNTLNLFLLKSAVSVARRPVLLAQISAWKARQLQESEVALFLDRRPWFGALQGYAAAFGVRIVQVPPPWKAATTLRQLIGPKGVEAARFLHYKIARFRRSSSPQPESENASDPNPAGESRSSEAPSKARMLIEYHGHLNLRRPEKYSDLFFWQQSTLSGEDIVVAFGLPQDPVDEERCLELEREGMAAVALQPAASKVNRVPLFLHWPFQPHAQSHGDRPAAGNRSEAAWLRERAAQYQATRDYWKDLFARNGVRIYLTWYKHGERHCAITDAVRELGGFSAIYQRSYEPSPSPLLTAAADVMFGFSSEGNEVERLAGSEIRYRVTTGYLGDHRFPLLRRAAGEVRDRLLQGGARRIVGFLDENSLDDSRWHTGHELQREGYAFFLEKVLSEKWLGLVLKPKVPGTLRRRLGELSRLLDDALATGRCYVHEGGALHGSQPPVAAALASDLMVHGCLAGGTAGMECALAGVPTLLMDREGWPCSPLYELGRGRVVFREWTEMWETCLQHWNRPSGVEGFGDWSPMLHRLDPFRDGRAAERMGTYLQWLLEGLKAGLERETVLADAAERYGALWGADKIAGIGGCRIAALSSSFCGAQAVSPGIH